MNKEDDLNESNETGNSNERTVKWCPHHKTHHPLEAFCVDRSKRYGRASTCSEGSKERRLAADRTGDQMTEADLRRIIGLLCKDGGCLTWGGSINNKGYGEISGFGQNKLIHRVMWEWWHQEPLAPELEIHHWCRTRSCCSPNHIEAMTRKDHERTTKEMRRSSES